MGIFDKLKYRRVLIIIMRIITKSFIVIISIFFLNFSSLLVSAVMFHASVSEQTPDTPVSKENKFVFIS